MSDNFIEKKLLYLGLFSLFLHAAVFILLQKLPTEKKTAFSEPFMVELQDMPAPTVSKPERRDTAKQQAETASRVTKETAPKGESARDRYAPRQIPVQSYPSKTQPAAASPSAASGIEHLPREELFRKQKAKALPEVARFYPNAGSMAIIEESYRKKYGPEVEEGETRFLNTDDILFGSFLRRFENAVYGVWRYPEEASHLGIEGITPVRITFNRRGEIVGTELLQGSGSKILDSEVIRTLGQIGSVGSFPKGYDKETFNLIAFFHYGIVQGARRTLR